MEIVVRTENELNFNWFKKGISSDFNFTFEKIPNPGDPKFLNLPEKLKNILRLDKPDLIISKKNENIERPILCIEITKSKPASQHIEQRIPRIIAAAESDVCSIYICPKKIDGYTYKFNPKHYDLLNKISSINKIPSVFFHYSNSNDILLDEDGFPGLPKLLHPNMLEMFDLIKDYINHDQNFENHDYKVFDCQSWKIKFEKQKNDTEGKIYKIEDLPTCKLINTSQLKNYLEGYQDLNINWINKTVENLPSRITSREKTLILQPDTKSSRLFAHAADPYVGMLGSFDYAFCRVGRNVEERKINLVFMPLNSEDAQIKKVMGPKGYQKYYDVNCPFKSSELENYQSQFKISHHLQYGCTYTKNKPLRIYGYFCDMMIFKDGVLIF